MELQRAFDTLGLERGASAEDVESAYRRLCDDFDSRIARSSSLALRDRYAEARAELDAARAAALQAPESEIEPSSDDPRARSWAVLGLAVGSSPLEVASAYVTLCEELDREIDSAPTEALRRRCLEARAEIDAAYQLCAANPLHDDPHSGRGEAGGYQTQMAAGAFEASAPEPEFQELPETEGLEIEPDPEPATRARRGRRLARRFGIATAAAAVLVGALFGYGWWTQTDWVHSLKRLLPLAPDSRLVEAQGAAEYLRRRVVEERRDLQQRAALTAERIERLQASIGGLSDPGERDRVSVALELARARGQLAEHLADLTERHVFSSSELAEAYGRIELAAELAASGEPERAIAAYSEARGHLESTLARLDEAEAAVGARSEALAARDAWLALATSAGLEESESIAAGDAGLASADERLEAGEFAAATPDLSRASQSYRAALGAGRKIVAARSDALLVAQRKAEAEALARAEAEARADSERIARAAAEARAAGHAAAPDVAAAPPPVTPSERAAVKLVAIPAGSFFFGCNRGVDSDCGDSDVGGGPVEIGSFRIDRTEVRVNEFARCVAAGRCEEPDAGAECNWGQPDRGDHPVNCIDWAQADAYCSWVGKRLPAEREWEKAARGTDGRRYPWGDEDASCDVAVMSALGGSGCGQSSTAPVGSRSDGRSPYGLFDMAGNVFEWTADPHEADDGTRVVRGGSWQSYAPPIRTHHRERVSPLVRHASIGFRCAQGGVIAATANAATP